MRAVRSKRPKTASAGPNSKSRPTSASSAAAVGFTPILAPNSSSGGGGGGGHAISLHASASSSNIAAGMTGLNLGLLKKPPPTVPPALATPTALPTRDEKPTLAKSTSTPHLSKSNSTTSLGMASTKRGPKTTVPPIWERGFPPKAGVPLSGGRFPGSAGGSGRMAPPSHLIKPQPFRSDALDLEVALAERLRRLESMAGDPDARNTILLERFRIYHQLFAAIIERVPVYGSLLAQVKAEYDQCVLDHRKVPAELLHDLESEQIKVLREQVQALEDENAALAADHARLSRQLEAHNTMASQHAEVAKLRQVVKDLQERCQELELSLQEQQAAYEEGDYDDDGGVDPAGALDDDLGSASDSLSDSYTSSALAPPLPSPSKTPSFVPQLAFDKLRLVDQEYQDDGTYQQEEDTSETWQQPMQGE